MHVKLERKFTVDITKFRRHFVKFRITKFHITSVNTVRYAMAYEIFANFVQSRRQIIAHVRTYSMFVDFFGLISAFSS
jgi:hypothetical protein